MEKSTDSGVDDEAITTSIWFGCHICCIRYFPDTGSLNKHKIESHSSAPTKCTRASVAKIKDCFNLKTNRSKKVVITDVMKEQRKLLKKRQQSKKVNGNQNKTKDVPSSASSKPKPGGKNSNSLIKLTEDVKTEIKQVDAKVEDSSSCSIKSVHKNCDEEELYIIEDDDIIIEKVIPAVMKKQKQEMMNATEITCITLGNDDDNKNADNDDTKRDDVKLSSVESDQLLLTKQNKSKSGINEPRKTRKRKNSSSSVGNETNGGGGYISRLRKRINTNLSQYSINVEPERSSFINSCVI